MSTAFTERLTEKLANAAAPLYPANQAFNNSTPFTVGPVDMSRYRRVLGIVNAGVLAANSNIAVVFQESTTSNGTFSNVASGAQVNITATNTLGRVEMRSDQMGSGNRFLRLALFVQVANAFVGAELLGGDSHYSPASQYNVGNATALLTSVM